MVTGAPWTTRHKVLLAASVAAGAGMWLAFDLFKTEPWNSPFGVLAIFAIGFVFGFLGRERPITWAFGILAGEVLFGLIVFLFGERGPNFFFPLGLLYLIPFTLLAGLGALVGGQVAARHWP